MNDFEGLLATDYGFKPQRKSPPMSSSSSSANNRSSSRVSNNPLSSDYDSMFRSSNPKSSSHDSEEFENVFGGPHKFTATSSSGFDFGSMFDAKKASNLPKFDKPLYDDDDDIFDWMPRLKMKNSSVNSKGNGAFDNLPGI